MKKILFFVVLFAVAIIAIGSLSFIALLGAGIILMILGIRNVIKSPALPAKLLWSVVVLAGIGILSRHIGFIIGLLALGGVYYLYNRYKNKKSQPKYIYDSTNFETFEKEWDHLKK